MFPMVSPGRSGSEVPVVMPRSNVVAITLLLVALAAGAAVSLATGTPIALGASLLIGLVVMQSPRVAQQWERAVVLRLGRFVGLRGPGLFWIIPFVDRVPSWIDQRTVTTTAPGPRTG